MGIDDHDGSSPYGDQSPQTSKSHRQLNKAKAAVVRTFRWMKRASSKMFGKKSWKATQKTAYGVSWTITGMFGLVGNGTYAITRWVGLTASYVVTSVTLLFVSILGTVGFLIDTTIYVIIKLVHFLSLVLCSPWIALHSMDALKDDWELFMTGIKPRNISTIYPQSLATIYMADRESRGATSSWREFFFTVDPNNSQQRAHSAASAGDRSGRSKASKAKAPRKTGTSRQRRAPRQPVSAPSPS